MHGWEEGGQGPSLVLRQLLRLFPCCLSRCWSLFILFFLKLRFAQESYLVGSDVGK